MSVANMGPVIGEGGRGTRYFVLSTSFALGHALSVRGTLFNRNRVKPRTESPVNGAGIEKTGENARGLAGGPGINARPKRQRAVNGPAANHDGLEHRFTGTWIGPGFLRLLLAVMLVLGCPGCAGYQLGERSWFRPDIRTVHVPMVQSESFRRYLGERLTEAVVKQVELRTPYKVVDSDAADSVLNVRLVSDSKKVLNNNRYSEPRDIETDFFIQTSWVDRRGSVIMSHDGIPAGPLLVNIGQQANFVPEGGQSLATAQQEAIEKLAQQIVGQMELAW